MATFLGETTEQSSIHFVNIGECSPLWMLCEPQHNCGSWMSLASPMLTGGGGGGTIKSCGLAGVHVALLDEVYH